MPWYSAGSLQAPDVTFTVLHPACLLSTDGRKKQDVEINFPRRERVTLACFCLPSTDVACLFVWLRWTESPCHWCNLTHFLCITFTWACKVGWRSRSCYLKLSVFAPLAATFLPQHVPEMFPHCRLQAFFLLETKLRCLFPLPQSAKHCTVNQL